MFRQIWLMRFELVRVEPGGNWVKVSSEMKQSPTLSGRATPSPKSTSGSSFHVCAFTWPVRQSSWPWQPVSVPPVPLKFGVVPTRTSRSTRFTLLHPLLSVTYNCTVHPPAFANTCEALAVLDVVLVPSPHTHVQEVMLKPAAATDALPLKLTASPGQIRAGAGTSMTAAAVGRAHGT